MDGPYGNLKVDVDPSDRVKIWQEGRNWSPSLDRQERLDRKGADTHYPAALERGRDG